MTASQAPAKPRPSPGQAPAKPRPSPGQAPAKPRPSPGQAPAKPRPSPGQAPAKPRPSPGQAPAKPRRPDGTQYSCVSAWGHHSCADLSLVPAHQNQGPKCATSSIIRATGSDITLDSEAE
ncbi:hypothetical protein NHX12_031299 [Muraenolepis orangiensis]|uniref:Uncharacterized protein n=1 Tax=Muraenolepis orangiensis TaxID=630683 RepID=A0A9Q0E5D0_9TELE|nr:hypothetical protein NHX12_031299 [Muraenolepis orangiensis]